MRNANNYIEKIAEMICNRYLGEATQDGIHRIRIIDELCSTS